MQEKNRHSMKMQFTVINKNEDKWLLSIWKHNLARN